MRIEEKTTKRVITETREVYIANDGKEFETRSLCEDYERDLRTAELEKKIAKLKIDKLDGVLPLTDSDDWRDIDIFWYNVKDGEDYDMIFDYFDSCSCVDCFREPKFYPTVMCVVDHDDFADVYYMDEIIDQTKWFFDLFNMDVNIAERK